MILSGIRVVEVGQWIMGPLAALILREMGAEVIKIEPPTVGDPIRGQRKLWGAKMEVLRNNITTNIGLEALNIGKKSVTLDIEKPRGKDVLKKLVKKTDILIAGLASSTLEKLGIDYEVLSRENPRLIVAFASAYGNRGPERGKRGQDTTLSAKSGAMYLMSSGDEPNYIPGAIIDSLAGDLCAFGCVSALLDRERTGKGRRVEVSLLGSGIWLQYFAAFTGSVTGQVMRSPDRKSAPNVLMNYYMCADKRWIAFGGPIQDRYWADFCKIVGIEHLREDPKYNNWMDRGKNVRELIPILDEIFRTKTLAEWVEIIQKSGSNLPYSPVNTIADVAHDDQAIANGYIRALSHPKLGLTKIPYLPIDFGEKADSVLEVAAPELGQHTEDVLLEVCGFTWDDIGILREEGVI